jgi:UPF0271 protein
MNPLPNIKNTKEREINIDINCDLGQSYGVYKSGLELKLLPYVSSVSIACGQHAGDPLTIKNILEAVSNKNISIGAHVGYPDIQGFGYRTMNLDDEEMQALIVYQIGALNSLAKIFNRKVEFVRPHGALYKQAAEDYKVSLSLAKALASYDQWLILIGPVGENLTKAGVEANIRVAPEIQLDKKYSVNGSIDFNSGDVNDLNYSMNLLETLIKDSSVPNIQGGKTKICYNTIHISYKNDASLQILQKLKDLVPSPIPLAGTYVASSGWVK